jgi:sugar phosphate isomerase/epimerase
MRYSIISYSFRRSFENGSMDIDGYIKFCQENGFTQLDPWMKHLEPGLTDRSWLAKVKEAGDATGLPFGCVAIDGGHIYEPTAEVRAKTRAVAYAWLDVAEFLGASQVRIDTGGRVDVMSNEMLAIIVDGYNELIPRAHAKGLEVIVENHWGPTKHPHNVVKVLEAVDGLGLLFDTNNWAEGEQELGWELCAKYASLTHIKTFAFDADGNDPSVNLSKAFRLLQESGYNGAWGIESVPHDGDERGAAVKTLALIKRELGVK